MERAKVLRKRYKKNCDERQSEMILEKIKREKEGMYIR